MVASSLWRGRRQFGVDHEHAVAADLDRRIPAAADEHVDILANRQDVDLDIVHRLFGGLVPFIVLLGRP